MDQLELHDDERSGILPVAHGLAVNFVVTTAQQCTRSAPVSHALERLKALPRQRVKMGGIEFDQVAEAQEDQKAIIDRLKRKQA